MTYKITVDVNLMNAETAVPGMETLKRWKDEGKLDLLEADPPRTAKAPAYGWPGAPPKPKETQSSWGEPKRRPKKMAESGSANFKSVASVLFPSKDPQKLNMGEINNVAHLIQHHISKNEIFVTGNSRDFIEGGRRDLLKVCFGIIAMTPEEAVKMLGEIQGWEGGKPPPGSASKSRAKRAP